MLRCGFEVASRWCSIVRHWGVFAIVVVWWDSLAHVGSDGQHPARRTDQYPTARETHKHTHEHKQNQAAVDYPSSMPTCPPEPS